MAKVLIVDDADDICFLLTHILKGIGIHADSAYTLSDAFIALNKNDYTIILLDNHLPDGLGIDNIERIKKSSPGSKVIIITASNNENKTIALQRGADFFIGKPFSKEIISQAITQFLN